MAVFRRFAAALLVVCVVGGVAVSAGPDAVAGAQDQPEPVVEMAGDEVGAAGLVSRWYFTNNLTGGAAEFELSFGQSADTDFYSGDWNANGIDDLAYRRNKTFTLLDLPTRRTAAISYGKPGDEVFVGDWDGNGTDTFAVRRGNIFYVKNSVASGNADVVIGYGRAGDEVFVGDWDSNGTDTFAVRRGNVFYVRNSVTTGVADVVFGYGRAADQVVVGDWNGDNIDSFGVRRGKEIFIRNDFATAPAEFSFAFGKATDELFPGDWNGDNIDTFAVRRVVEATSVELRADGLGPVSFGDPATIVMPLLVGLFGQPTEDEVLTEGHGFMGFPEPTVRFVSWDGLQVGFIDNGLFRPDNVSHLFGWLTGRGSTAILATSSGISVGSSFGALRAAYPGTTASLSQCGPRWVASVGELSFVNGTDTIMIAEFGNVPVPSSYPVPGEPSSVPIPSDFDSAVITLLYTVKIHPC
jgi:hypothetical protein